MKPTEAIRFDARGLEHPKPLEEAVWHLRHLEAGQYLHMIHRRCPHPLLEICDKNGFRYRTRSEGEELWHILIAKDPEVTLDTLIEEAVDV